MKFDDRMLVALLGAVLIGIVPWIVGVITIIQRIFGG